MAVMMYLFSIFVICSIYISYKLFPLLMNVYISTKAIKRFSPVKPHWFWGHMRMLPGATQDTLMLLIEWTKRAPKYFAVMFGPFRPSLILTHPDTVKVILKTAEPKSMSNGGGYELLSPWIGDGLLLSKGEKWFRNRRLLTPGFHFDVLKPYVNVYNTCVKKLLRTFETESAGGTKSVEIFRPVGLCTLSIILKCAFSYDEDVQLRKTNGHSYFETVIALGKLVSERTFRPHLYINSLYYRTKSGKAFRQHCESSHKTATDVIHRRRLALQAGQDPTSSSRYVDFLDILLLAKDEDGRGLTDSEIRDEVETFMFEGHDTTSSGITWALYNLAKHPEYQQKAFDEVNSIMNTENGGTVLWEDLSKMEYLTMCIKESLRLYPPVTLISRELTKPLALDGHIIPKGTITVVPIWCVHHNPTVWGDDHMEFKPERFAQENLGKMDPFAFIAFSAGPRNCIGQVFALNEMKCTIAKILYMFQLSLDETQNVEMVPELILKPKDGIKLFFKKRQQ